MFTHLLTLLVLVATAECQGAWDARAQRHSPQGFSLTGGHQHKVHASHNTAQSSPPPQQASKAAHSAISSHSVAKETAQQHASSNNAALQAKKTETVNNVKTPYSSIPSHGTKHDAGWAAVQKGEVPYHTQPSEGMSKNVKRLLPHTKNSVSIVDHIWKMFQINPLKQTRTQEATNPGTASAQGFRVKSRVAFQPTNLVQKIGKNHNNHNHHQSSHKNNHSNNNHQNTNHLQSSNHFNDINNHHKFNTHMSNTQNHNQHYNQHNIPNNNYNNQNNNNNNNHHTNNIYNQPRNNTGKTGKFQGNVINPIKNVLKRVLSPYDKIQTGLESIKSEVGVQQGMLGQLQSSMDKMKEIFFSIQTDMKNVLSSINSIMKMQ